MSKMLAQKEQRDFQAMAFINSKIFSNDKNYVISRGSFADI